MTDAQKTVVKLVSCELNGRDVCDVIDQCPVSAAELFETAYGMKMLHLIFDSAARAFTGKADAADIEFFRNVEYRSLTRNVNQLLEYDKLADAAEKAGIKLLMLKGIYVRRFYPEPEKREMGDIDMMYLPQDKRKVKSLMQSLGYDMCSSSVNHETWTSTGSGVSVEMHHSLGDEETYSDPFFSDVFGRAVKDDGRRYIYRMTDSDAYVHVIQHLRHHMQNGNWVFRQLADVYVLRKYAQTDFSSVRQTLKSVGLEEFEKNIAALAGYLFDGEDASDDIRQLAEFFLGNLKFGSINPYVARQASRNKTGAGYIFSKVFPDKTVIYLSFPYIGEHRMLLPAGYVMRIAGLLIRYRKGLKNKLKFAQRISPQAVEEGRTAEEFYKKYGI